MTLPRSTSAEQLRNVQLLEVSNSMDEAKERDEAATSEVLDQVKHCMDLSSVSNHDAEVSLMPSGAKDMQTGDSCNKRRNLGSPVIVESLSNDFASLNVPKAFAYSCQLNPEAESFEGAALLGLDVISDEREACIVVARSINPKAHSDTMECREKLQRLKPSPKKYNRNPGTNRKSPRKESSNVSGSNFSPTTHEKCAESVNIHMDEEKNKQSENVIPTVQGGEPLQWAPNENMPRFYCLTNNVLVVMGKKSRFCFTGKLNVKVLHGAVEVYGFVITAEQNIIEVYSPRGHSSVAIENSEKVPQEAETDIWLSLLAEGINRDSENELVVDINGIQPGTAVLLLSNIDNKLVKFLNVFYPYRLFPKIRNEEYYSWTDPRRAEVILESNLYFGNFNCKELIVDPCVVHEVREKMLSQWRANQWSCTLIAGGKNVGKSTATRYLINSLLPHSMVVLIDLDPGQSELTPPSCISYSLIEKPLMGPNFTHLKTPIYQLYIGDVNVARCLTQYIQALKMLIDRLMSCPILSRLPIVVNTMGFTHGIGWDIAIFTIKLIRPSIVVQIESERPKNNYAYHLSRRVVNTQKITQGRWGTKLADWSKPCKHELRVIRSHAENRPVPGVQIWNMEPHQQRELVMISYLSEILQNFPINAPYYDTLSLNVNEARPYAMPFSSFIVSMPRGCVSPSYVLKTVNGNLVALCGIDLTRGDLYEGVAPCGLRVLYSSPLCACYGFGIVRGVDNERKELYVNTPLTASMMLHVNCLVGCIPVPLTILEANRQRNSPYTGEDKLLPTNREHRRGYFRKRQRNPQN